MTDPHDDNPSCPNCNGPVMVRNPTGKCDHLYWPDLLTPEAKEKVGPVALDRIGATVQRRFSARLNQR